MAVNVLFIARQDGTFEAVADEPVTVYFRNDRHSDPAIPYKLGVMTNPHEFSREVSGVEVVRYSAEEVASWILVNQTAREAMADAALGEAEKMGLVNNVNRDHATIIVTFDKTTSDWHCYLEFEEDV